MWLKVVDLPRCLGRSTKCTQARSGAQTWDASDQTQCKAGRLCQKQSQGHHSVRFLVISLLGRLARHQNEAVCLWSQRDWNRLWWWNTTDTLTTALLSLDLEGSLKLSLHVNHIQERWQITSKEDDRSRIASRDRNTTRRRSFQWFSLWRRQLRQRFFLKCHLKFELLNYWKQLNRTTKYINF